MSQLSYMEKLLDGVEVEWKALGGLGELVRGNGLPKTDFTESGVPAIHYGQIYTFYGLSTESTKSYVSHETAKKLKKVNTGDVVITNTSENFADVGKALVYLGKVQAVTGGHATIFKPNNIIIGKYFAYFTQTNVFASEKRKLSKGTKVIDVSATDMAKILIPIPCPDNPEKSLAIQAEIVRILDAFTAMTAELTAELNMRKKQYNYYRDQLLSFEEGEVEWKTLGDVTQLITKGTTPKEFVSDGVNFIKLESFDDNQIKPDKFMFITPEVHNKELKRSILEEGDILFAIAGATIGKCAIVDKSVLPANTNQALAIVRLTQQVNVKFAFYYMQTTAMTDYIAKFNKTSAQPNINLKQMSEFKIPVPTINEQIRIVKILDNFNTLTSSIKEGLPREIELRQKQYEYYRDLLLSFPKSHSDEAA